jgi:hypothetical protein
MEPGRDVAIAAPLGLLELRAPLSVVEGVPEARFSPEEVGVGIDEAIGFRG